ncbi:hypothetical protein L829_4055 [Mycobacteroides abscessus MAB_030201_1075]|uniref:Uncharacterized protein n=1 Tax=Mycobacteroides abscessus MAB_030201_1075 TaxID=1335410 RepID=A0A829PTH6_9MYCO|nr:hypothetical protein L829_4055 [Mycobacteroides abscessus MAB_030201_1075]
MGPKQRDRQSPQQALESSWGFGFLDLFHELLLVQQTFQQ